MGIKQVTIRKQSRKVQGQAQAARRGRAGRRAGKMSGNDGANSKS